MRVLLLTLFALMLPVNAQASKVVPRTLVALFDTREESTPRMTHTHRFFEMPANYYGYDIQYYPINKPLPKLGEDVAGIVLWFDIGTEVKEPMPYLDWLIEAQDNGKKIVIIENGGIGDTLQKDLKVLEKWNRVLNGIGIEKGSLWIPLTHNLRIDRKDEEMIGFERTLGPVLAPFTDTHIVHGRGKTHLRVSLSGEEPGSYDLVITSDRGGYIAENYAMFHYVENDEAKLIQWIVNPFLFFTSVFGQGQFPVPDTTTLAGRRIFYSHIDGDGWNNLTEIVKYAQEKTLSAEVIKKDIFEAYPDYAFSVGVISGEIDPECFAVPGSERVAREILALPNVEAGSHTHSHPFYWQYFADYTPQKEQPLLSRYPEQPALSMMDDHRKTQAMEARWERALKEKRHQHYKGSEMPPGHQDMTEEEALEEYHTPRSYACAPFDLDNEISGSIARIEKLLPPGKRVEIVQWPGDTSPFAGALAKVREAGIYNINGGDSRFDRDYPSYSYVSPVGVQIGKERQIYSSNSNENTYTNLWTGPFFGFRNLQRTVENTESPIRLKPFNVYFHMYSGQKEASLNALRENMNYARTQPLIPITASHYAAIANGFYDTKLIRTEDGWLIKDRGKLQTLRFDGADEKQVNLSASQGVMGWTRTGKQLYIALDPAVEEARLVLEERGKDVPVPYLVESSWPVKALSASAESLAFGSQGFGKGVMQWQMPKEGRYTVTASKEGESAPVFKETFETKEQGMLSFSLPSLSSGTPLSISITRS